MIKPLDVLLVEDEPYTREIMEVLLLDLGHRVHSSTNGREAVTYCVDEAKPVDVVLMDLQMPVMNGLDAMRALRANPRTAEVAIVCISAKVQGATKEEGLLAGADCYLTKPMTQARIFEAVTSTLHRKGLLAPNQTFS